MASIVSTSAASAPPVRVGVRVGARVRVRVRVRVRMRVRVRVCRVRGMEGGRLALRV